MAVSDEDLIGKVFENGDFQLDVKESFYRGETKSAEEVKEILENMKIEDATFNIVGNESVKLALENGIISEEHIGEISGIKFAMVFM